MAKEIKGNRSSVPQGATEPASGPVSPLLAQTIAKHKDVFSALSEACKLASECGDDEGLGELLLVERRVMGMLAQAPCRSDDEFFAKAAHLLDCEIVDLSEPEIEHEFGATAMALREYLKHRAA